ncbi:AAA family ATPase [Aureimonas sp. Leaf460]|uniref:AAA family ATPase n=1 Tax=Aureimonas sp. Leaf460 TaxID=1736384 RepID=UPI0006FF47FE|nr:MULTISPECIES: AAA family ATPase [unclassified Aureimonas]KQT52792.1 AAA family ATPase [Aureimonas sp. Leaf427]KQT80251.1 AAA family ATPase [Aureimonas sp. Leaf460]
MSSSTATKAPSGADAAVRLRLERLKTGLQDGLIGCETLVERLLIGLLSGGHLLVEGMPGLAKTRAVKRLSEGLEASFHRVQCTPDLMPADITGTPVFQPAKGTFEFSPGPVFASLVLVDEINRAPPKVQSALLEAMAERQVTSGGQTHALPDPFMVVATQNPIEQEGTFPLPEAQLDRFLMHVVVGLPDAAAERRILDLVEAETVSQTGAMATKLTLAEVREARDAAMRVHLSPALKDFIVRLVTAPRSADPASEIGRAIEHPPSPRGTLALAASAKARAYLHGRDFAIPEDVADLAGDVLAHRTLLTWRASADGQTPRGVIRRLLGEVAPL